MKDQVLILGDGQLAMMLAEACLHLNVQVFVLTDSPDSPAARIKGVEALGSSELEAFLEKHPEIVGLAESEFFDFSKCSETLSKKMFPSVASLQRLRNKLNQKQLADRLGIEQAEFRDLDLSVDLLSQLKGKERWVLKWAELGYDGYGNLVWNSAIPETVLTKFLTQAREKSVSVFAEEWVEFESELAIACSRSRSNQFHFYPLVKSEQKNQACWKVRGPATKHDISEAIEQQARQAAEKFAQESGLYGSFALEFFHTKEGKLLFNEIAPRVHNSAHFSLLDFPASQFSNHIRAALSQDVREFQSPDFFGMLNLLSPFSDGLPKALSLEEGSQQDLVWYSKKSFRQGRKMGHIHFSASSAHELDNKFIALQSWEKRFWQSMRGES